MSGIRLYEVVNGRPPNYDEILAVFPGASEPGVMFAFGGKIYAPNVKVSIELHAHEGVHLERQGKDAAGWWKRYLADRYFRFDEEARAHRAEYQRYCARHLDGIKRAQALRLITRKLAAPLYQWGVDLPLARVQAVIASDAAYPLELSAQEEQS